MGDAAGKSGAELRQHGSDQDIELVLLASAGAIQRLIAERNTLRVRVGLWSATWRLQRHVALIHGSYRRLTTEFVTQFQLIDSAVSNFVRDPGKPAVALTEERGPLSDA